VGRPSAGWPSGSTRAWRRVRARVLDRDGHTCRLRLPGCTGRATHVHHVIGKQYGDDEAQLVAACEACNLTTGDPERHDPPPRPRTEW
jgi:5-methylcytosine-specific restriction endonuclease McrA